ncbi:MAG: hypothetical protein JXR25_16475 [Pontiellaceae bacterium]|nr:hypothetical protein [Pontiellaceae bacterium]MBN2786417.1 hypothetical protein [Pontiellaceae bacterium]
MIGKLIKEERFLHQGIDHHLFAAQSEQNPHEVRFEVRCIPPGADTFETVYERIVDFSDLVTECPDTPLSRFIEAELAAVRLEIFAEEAPHAHDP